MPTNDHPTQPSSCEVEEEVIRKNLDALLDLLAREVARRLPRETENGAGRSRRPSKEHPLSAS
jgi:hypothetical protein